MGRLKLTDKEGEEFFLQSSGLMPRWFVALDKFTSDIPTCTMRMTTEEMRRVGWWDWHLDPDAPELTADCNTYGVYVPDPTNEPYEAEFFVVVGIDSWSSEQGATIRLTSWDGVLMQRRYFWDGSFSSITSCYFWRHHVTYNQQGEATYEDALEYRGGGVDPGVFTIQRTGGEGSPSIVIFHFLTFLRWVSHPICKILSSVQTIPVNEFFDVLCNDPKMTDNGRPLAWKDNWYIPAEHAVPYVSIAHLLSEMSARFGLSSLLTPSTTHSYKFGLISPVWGDEETTTDEPLLELSGDIPDYKLTIGEDVGNARKMLVKFGDTEVFIGRRLAPVGAEEKTLINIDTKIVDTLDDYIGEDELPTSRELVVITRSHPRYNVRLIQRAGVLMSARSATLKVPFLYDELVPENAIKSADLGYFRSVAIKVNNMRFFPSSGNCDKSSKAWTLKGHIIPLDKGHILYPDADTTTLLRLISFSPDYPSDIRRRNRYTQDEADAKKLFFYPTSVPAVDVSEIDTTIWDWTEDSVAYQYGIITAIPKIYNSKWNATDIVTRGATLVPSGTADEKVTAGISAALNTGYIMMNAIICGEEVDWTINGIYMSTMVAKMSITNMHETIDCTNLERVIFFYPNDDLRYPGNGFPPIGTDLDTGEVLEYDLRVEQDRPAGWGDYPVVYQIDVRGRGKVEFTFDGTPAVANFVRIYLAYSEL